VTQVRILVADDHDLIRRGVRTLAATQRGWRVVGEAVNGLEAVEKVEELRPDLAIVDITMPDLDGLEATRRIRQRVPETRVLILSMHESEQMVEQARMAGAQGYVLKSDLSNALLKAIHEVSQGKQFFTPKASEAARRGRQNTEAEQEKIGPSKEPLTPREVEVIRLLAEGRNNKEIAAEWGISVRTVETHRAKVMLKLGLHSLTEIVRYAIRNKIVLSR